MKRLFLVIFAITLVMLTIGCGNSSQKKQDKALKSQLAEIETLLESIKNEGQPTDKEQIEYIETLLDSLKNNASLSDNRQLVNSADIVKDINSQTLGLGNIFSISSFSDIKKAYDEILKLFGSNDADLMSSLKSSLNAISRADSIMNASTNTFSDINKRMNKADNNKNKLPSETEGEK